MRCPDSKAHALLAVALDKMSAEHLICMIIRPLMEEIEVELA